jgi:general nucleoside transport system permease protein
MNDPTFKKIQDAILVPLLAILSGLVLMGILILLLKKPVFESYYVLFTKGFGCEAYGNCVFISTLERATPIILTGLSAVVAFRSGLFSIGQEGQYLFGAAAVAWLGYVIHLPPIIHPIVLMLAAMAIGAAYGWIPGILKVKIGVNELLATIMLNSIAVLVVEYLVQFPMRAEKSTTAHSPVIDESAWLMSFLPGSKWGVGFVIAVIAVVAVYIYLWRTKYGYEQRMAGQSSRFALYGGIRSDRSAIRAMLISGALAGLAGGIEVMGVHHRIMTGFSVGLGFDGLTAAILGGVHPVGVFIVAILFSGLKLGAQLGLQLKLGIPRELGGTIIGFIILFVAAASLYQSAITRVRDLLDKRQARRLKGEGD